MAESLLDIGKIVGTHGLRGDMKIRLKSGDPDLLMTVKNIHLRLPTGKTLEADIIRQVLHKGQVLLRLRGYESINLIEPLVGGQILVDQELLPALGDNQYYWGDLKGLEVVDQNRGMIGTLNDMFSSAAHDTYVVEGCFGEVLIPAVRQFILDVDLNGRVMHVALPEGLIPEQQ